MKFVLAVAVTALVAVTYGAPVANVDWTAVGNTVNDIESAVVAAVQQVNAAAKRDNPTIGADIERKLGVKAVEARGVLAEARTAIEGRSLTEATARTFFARLRNVLNEAQDDILADVRQLSPAAQQEISIILATNLNEAEELANKLYELLKETSTFAPDWTIVSRKVNEAESAIVAAVQQVSTVAKESDLVIGADIERKLAARAVDARGVLADARRAIEGRSLTEDSAKAFFARLREILEAARADITPDVQKLPPSFQLRIREILEGNLATVEGIANEIYAELRK